MAMRTKCPHCGEPQRVDAEHGERVECGECSKTFRLKAPGKKEEELVSVEAVNPDEEGYEVGGGHASNAASELSRHEMKQLKRKMKREARIRKPSGGGGNNAAEWIHMVLDVVLIVFGLAIMMFGVANIIAATESTRKLGATSGFIFGLTLLTTGGRRLYSHLSGSD